MEVLLLGSLIPQNMKNKFLDLGIRPAPGDIAQMYVIQGLLENDAVNSLSVIGSPRIAAYPWSNVVKAPDADWNIGEAKVKTVGYINVPILGFLQRAFLLVRETKKWIRETPGDKVILAFALHTPFLAALKLGKICDHHIRTAVIVTDLPQFMGKYGKLKNMLKRIDCYLIDKLRKSVDSYILYTKYMADVLDLQDGTWIVMEGLIDTSKIKANERQQNNKQICIYAGDLNPQYAINTLVEAFECSDADAELHIYGDCSVNPGLRDSLQKAQKTVYKGILPSDRMFLEMRKADLLINPRPSNLALAKYSCPSKTFEYMATGSAVLTTKLPGIPEEYFKYVYTFYDETKEGFKRSLEYVLSRPYTELREIGQSAQLFLKNNKSTKKQVEKIIRFIQSK